MLYLQRIGYTGSLEPTPAALRDLQMAHLQTVPFENLDIHLGREIVLDIDAFFEKIVVRRRGGFCYELNGLFSVLLSQLGFTVTLLSASDSHYDGGYGAEFDHLTLAVQCPGNTEQRWLADVGWGDSFLEPLILVENVEQGQGRRAYRIDCEADYHLLWQRDYNGEWEKQYRFTLQPRQLEDFSQMCAYHQTSPLSSFTRKRICTLATPEGRITVEPTRLITSVSGERTEQPVEGEEDFRRILAERFGIFIFHFSEREQEVLRLLAQGLTNTDIARQLYLSEGTVRNYTSEIFKKLGVSDRTQAAVAAIRYGLVDL